MANRNGYFQIVTHNDKSFLKLVPPAEGGEPISITEVRDYLASTKIDADISTINTVLLEHTAEVELPLPNKVAFIVNESFKIDISEDRMKATARFYPAISGGGLLDYDSIINELKFRKVTCGIKEDVIKGYLGNRQYCTDYVLAEGVLPTRGTDARIEYFFNTNPNLKPALNPDGTVDFFNLEVISKCEKGQVLATLTPEVKGKEGVRVTGDRLLPPEVKSLSLSYASNIIKSDDGLSLISQVDGHVSLVDNKVFVSNVYEVVDVDTSTGNIDFPGDVLVTGNVKTGFCVEAEGNVEVRGVVEGALIKATGNVIIARGVNGMGKGIISADGNVVAKFIENANVQAGGYVHSEAIIHSKVNARSDVTVNGKKGFIVGGSVKALGNVEAKTIGSDMGGETEIEVGSDPKIKQRAANLDNLIKTSKANIEKIEPILTAFAQKIKEKAPLTAEQINYFKKLSDQYKIEKQNLQDATIEYEEINKDLAGASTDSCVLVSEIMHPGTKLTINEVSKTITKPSQHSRFIRDGADIRIAAY